MHGKTTAQTKSFFHNESAYVSFQFPLGSEPLITPQFWMYAQKHGYFEARYNYEDRKAVSLYYGHSMKFGANNEFEIIPMIGGVVGNYYGISPDVTMLLKIDSLSCYSANQYTFNLNNRKPSFFFTWTKASINVSRVFGVGVSIQIQSSQLPMYVSPMCSIKIKSLTLECFVYNFWDKYPMPVLAVQYDF